MEGCTNSLSMVSFFNAKSQRSKGAKGCWLFQTTLCVFAPLRLCVKLLNGLFVYPDFAPLRLGVKLRA